MINTHPAPLRRSGGKGMFGEQVHRAVLESGMTASAAAVHLVDPEYDTGRVIAQRPVPVLAKRRRASLRDRVQRAERELLLETVAKFARESAPEVREGPSY